MKAILLAAGVGRRLTAALGDKPKCMLPVGGRALLERLLGSLGRAGVETAVVVVGYRREVIETAIGPRCGNVAVRYVFNPEFEKGAILSLWSARAEFDDDILVMDADVLCSDEMLSRLVRSPHPNCFLLDGNVAGSGEEQMLMVRDGRVLDIARQVKPGYDLAGESVGFLKVSRRDAPRLLAVLEQCVVQQGRDRIEHEEAYPIFMREVIVGYERVDDLPWTEIDFPEDVERAERDILPRIEKSGARS